MITKIKRELLKVLWVFMPKTIKIKFDNIKFKIPIQYGLDHRIMGKNRERWMDDLIKLSYQCSTGAFIDVGANAGQTLLKVKSLMPQLEYLGFEPNTCCAGYINEIIQVNHFENCTIWPIGLGDRDAVVPLFCHHRADPTGTVVENFRGTDPALYKQMVLIRDARRFLEGLHVQEIAVVKIDVEGYEAAVLAGLKEILR